MVAAGAGSGGAQLRPALPRVDPTSRLRCCATVVTAQLVAQRAEFSVGAGDSFKSCLVAVAVPNRSHLLEWAVGEGTEAAGGLEGVCVEAAAGAHVLQALQAQGRASNLRGFEIVKAVHLHPQEFRVEDGVVTPTFKLRRPQLLATFQAQVNAMYKQLGA